MISLPTLKEGVACYLAILVCQRLKVFLCPQKAFHPTLMKTALHRRALHRYLHILHYIKPNEVCSKFF